METAPVTRATQQTAYSQIPQRELMHAASPRDLPCPPDRNERGSGWIERRLLRRLLRHLGDPPLAFVLWDGAVVTPEAQSPRMRVHFTSRAATWRVLRNPQLAFGEEYVAGRVRIDGDLTQLFRLAFQQQPVPVPGPLAAFRRGLKRIRRANTLTRARNNIRHHYDLSNDFYKLWLDERMLYTCAYFAAPDMTLEQAQVAKMDHICRKLQLQPGETVIEAGCGWGGMALHMARVYGVTVRAYNISHEQIAFARERSRAENLDDRVEFIEDDWRNITGTCDALVSVGMLEHVGIENYRQLGRVIQRSLHPQGRGLIHTIGRNVSEPMNAWTDRYIFPGARPPSLAEMMEIFEIGFLSVLDVENLRLHYAVTLHHWLQRFDENVDEVRDLFDEKFVRMWRMYLASSMATFEAGRLQLFQVLFAPGKCNQVPWTRDYMYSQQVRAERGAVWAALQGELTS